MIKLKTKDIYLEMCKKSDVLHKLSSHERKQLQRHLCKMYQDIEMICDNHGLKLMLAYGSALGAIRHKGFIPWDDDLDLFMPREDYDKFITIYADELPDNYILYAPNSKNGAIARFAKVVDKNTRFVEVNNEKIDYPGVFVDIFPLDSISINSSRNRICRVISMFLMYTAGSVRQYQCNNKTAKMIMSGSFDGKFNYWFRYIYGMCFSFIDECGWYRAVDSFCRNTAETGYMDFLQSSYRWKPIKKETFLPPIRGEFEDIQVYLPHLPIDYLEEQFGDWERIPNEDERPEHYVLEFKI